MEWEVEFTDEFGNWWDGLSAGEQEDVRARVNLLRKHGPHLKFPYCSGVKQSKLEHMRELRVQHAGRPYRVLYAFDSNRAALLLIGADKTGDGRWYEKFVPIADRLYQNHLRELRREQDQAAKKGGNNMARNFRELEAKMMPEQIARSNEKTAQLEKEMALHELRAALEYTQEHLAGLLQINQAAVSKMERRTDMYVSTLADFIRVMGGELEITAKFPSGRVRIKQFGAVQEKPTAPAKRLAKVSR